MKIGIDCRTILSPNLGEKAGVGHYTFYLVKNLLEIDKKNEYILFFDHRAPNIKGFEKKNTKIIKFPFSQYKKYMPFGYSHLVISAVINRKAGYISWACKYCADECNSAGYHYCA